MDNSKKHVKDGNVDCDMGSMDSFHLTWEVDMNDSAGSDDNLKESECPATLDDDELSNGCRRIFTPRKKNKKSKANIVLYCSYCQFQTYISDILRRHLNERHKIFHIVKGISYFMENDSENVDKMEDTLCVNTSSCQSSHASLNFETIDLTETADDKTRRNEKNPKKLEDKKEKLIKKRKRKKGYRKRIFLPSYHYKKSKAKSLMYCAYCQFQTYIRDNLKRHLKEKHQIFYIAKGMDNFHGCFMENDSENVDKREDSLCVKTSSCRSSPVSLNFETIALTETKDGDKKEVPQRHVKDPVGPHLNGIKFKCSYCPKVFHSRETLHNHTNSHKDILQCSYCNFATKFLTLIKKHLWNCHKIRCPKCPVHYFNTSEKNSLLLACKTSRPIDSLNFKRSKILSKNSKIFTHSNILSNKRYNMVSNKEVQSQLKVSKKNLSSTSDQIPVGNKTTDEHCTESDLINDLCEGIYAVEILLFPQDGTSTHVQCCFCTSSLLSFAALNKHLQKYHLCIESFNCKKCHVTKYFPSVFINTVKIQHICHEDQSSSNQNCLNNKYKNTKLSENTSEYVSDTFPQNTMEDSVQKELFTLKKYKCEFCNYCFDWFSSLMTHINTIHLYLVKFACSNCDFSRFYPNILYDRIKTLHKCNVTKLKYAPVIDQVSSEDSKSDYNFKSHDTIVSCLEDDIDVSVGKKIDCNLCDFQAESFPSLKSHANLMHNNELVAYHCLCGYSRTILSSLSHITKNFHKCHLNRNEFACNNEENTRVSKESENQENTNIFPETAVDRKIEKGEEENCKVIPYISNSTLNSSPQINESDEVKNTDDNSVFSSKSKALESSLLDKHYQNSPLLNDVNSNGCKKNPDERECGLCGFISKTKLEFQDHKATHLKKTTIPCPLCEFSSYGITSMRKHIQNIHESTKENSKSDVCEIRKSNRKKSKVSSFESDSHPKSNLENKSEKNLNYQDRSMSNTKLNTSASHTSVASNLKNHPALRKSILERFLNKYVCDVCGYGTETEEDLASHIKSHSRNFCAFCEFSSTEVTALNYHIKSVHRDPKENSKSDVCEIRKSNRKKSKVSSFESDSHPKSNLENKSEKNLNYQDRSMSNTKLNTSASHTSVASNLKNHPALRKSILERFLNKYVCDVCGYGTETEEDLASHIKSHSRNICAFCEFSSTEVTALNYHIKSVHRDPKENSKSDVCEIRKSNRKKSKVSSFESDSHPKSNLENKSEKNLNYQDRSMSNTKLNTSASHTSVASNLKNHPALRKSILERFLNKYVCDVCGYGTETEEDLASHIKSHSRNSCSFCEFSSTEITALNYHIKSVHRDPKGKTGMTDTNGRGANKKGRSLSSKGLGSDGDSTDTASETGDYENASETDGASETDEFENASETALYDNQLIPIFPDTLNQEIITYSTNNQSFEWWEDDTDDKFLKDPEKDPLAIGFSTEDIKVKDEPTVDTSDTEPFFKIITDDQLLNWTKANKEKKLKKSLKSVKSRRRSERLKSKAELSNSTTSECEIPDRRKVNKEKKLKKSLKSDNSMRISETLTSKREFSNNTTSECEIPDRTKVNEEKKLKKYSKSDNSMRISERLTSKRELSNSTTSECEIPDSTKVNKEKKLKKLLKSDKSRRRSERLTSKRELSNNSASDREIPDRTKVNEEKKLKKSLKSDNSMRISETLTIKREFSNNTTSECEIPDNSPAVPTMNDILKLKWLNINFREISLKFGLLDDLSKNDTPVKLSSNGSNRGRNKCHFCKFTTNSINILTTHEKSIHTRKSSFYCAFCVFMASTNRAICIHLIFDHSSGPSWDCVLCEHSYPMRWASHCHRGIKSDTENSPFICEGCNYIFLTGEDFLYHVFSEHYSF